MSLGTRLMIVDDEPDMRGFLEAMLVKEGYRVVVATSGEHALELFQSDPVPVVILDVVMGGISGISVLKQIRDTRPDTRVIMLTGYANLDDAVSALRLGAFDFLRKGPRVWDELLHKVKQAFNALGLDRQNLQLRRELERSHRFVDMVGQSSAMQQLYRFIEQVAVADINVLIRGETGTGKELVAKSIHTNSTRKDKPFVPVDCNIPETLAESMLFGVTKDFPGLHHKEPFPGLFELADGGTLFLDEIGDLPFTVQPKLLRTIQEGEIRPLGAPHTIRVDVRIVAATNRNLEQAMQNGTFRDDLYHRLNTMELITPPLRERQEDIPELLQHVLTKTCEKLKRPAVHLSDEALQRLLEYDYPGNVRELENLIDRAVILTTGDEIQPDVLPIEATHAAPQEFIQRLPDLTLAEAKLLVEKMYLEVQLRNAEGNISRAARKAGIDRKNFRNKLKQHRLYDQPPDDADSDG